MPLSASPRIGFIGAGRLARCVARRLARAGYSVAAIASRSAASAAALAKLVDIDSAAREAHADARPAAPQAARCVALDSPQAVVDHVELIFLSVPDDALAEVAASLRFAPDRARGQALVHCSGASSLALLAPARTQRAATGSFHPLYLFGGGDADLTRIEGCSVAIEADGVLNDLLAAFAAALGCHPLPFPQGKLTPDDRMLYHAAAHYAASFTLSNLAECVELWRTLGLAEDDALRALLPMLAGTLETARDKGLANALSGPVSRGDAGVVARQLARLASQGGDHAAFYALHTRRALALARRRTPSSVPPASLDAIERAVAASLAPGRAATRPADGEP
ncbi:DUF2520 domain-containing protein [Burkholderia sp. TSV86]|uniref:DUF2520 domain-containing protein n=1 Tax=Burkholderia sp. TSV86 TaxID=1385594 RepID=UPI000754026B|nr:DUF2520 domain-containing protein [Burkholderia sp. TSV86]KVE34769.1 F420-dependent NADP oxidoreductase [Burkholderia sp. TSV86]